MHNTLVGFLGIAIYIALVIGIVFILHMVFSFIDLVINLFKR